MAVLRIRLYPDPVLRVDCPPVSEFDAELERLATDMVETMYAAPGVGLAAPQVGVEKSLAVVDVTVGEEEGALIVLVNPEIVAEDGKERDLEGCLSIPGIQEKVARPTRIVVRAQDLAGQPIELEADDFTARAICHEIDHLRGVLFTDRLTGLKREKAKRQLRRLAKAAEVPAY